MLFKQEIQSFKCITILVMGCLFLIEVPNAQASTTGGVGSASVDKGKLTAEMRVGFSADDSDSTQDDRLRTRVQADYGFTDFYAGRLIVSQDNRKGNDMEHDSITLEHRFHILEKDNFDFGARAAYSMKDGDKKPDSANFRLIQVFKHEGLELRLNQIFSTEIGEDREGGIAAESRAQITSRIYEDYRLGIESYNDFGTLNNQYGFDEQVHTIGPILKGKLHGIGFETGYRVGLSEAAPNHSLKFFLKKSF